VVYQVRAFHLASVFKGKGIGAFALYPIFPPNPKR